MYSFYEKFNCILFNSKKISLFNEKKMYKYYSYIFNTPILKEIQSVK